jgi:predicted permease
MGHDLRHAFRVLRRSPGLAAVAVLSLALGVGANTAIFSVVNAVLLRGLPLRDAARLADVSSTVRREGVELRAVSLPDFVDWRSQAGVFETMAAWSSLTLTVTGEGPPERVEGEVVSGTYFHVLGVAMQRGRGFTADEDAAPGARPAAVVSWGFSARRFGGNAVGKILTLNGSRVPIVGVAPPGFQGLGDNTDVWLPMAMLETSLPGRFREARGTRWLSVVGRLRPGAATKQAQTELDTITSRLAQQYVGSNTNYGAFVTPLADRVIGPMRPALLTLLAAVTFVLLIACANLANLLLTRAIGRRRDSAVRAALGAGRWRLLRQFIAEGLLLVGAGGFVGLLVAGWAVDAIVAAGPVALPSFVHPTLDGRVLLYTLAVAALTGVGLGLAPGMQASRTDLGETLKEGGRGGTGGAPAQRLRAGIVVAEVALALLLLAGAGLLVRTLREMQTIDLGFDAAGVEVARVSLPARYSGVAASQFADQVLERLRAAPGVRAAALSTDVPFDGNSSATLVTVEGHELPLAERGTRIYQHAVTPGFFETAGIRILRGRGVAPQDTAEAPPVVIVSEKLVRRFWPNEDPLGRRIKFGRASSSEPWMSIVGVAGDVRYRSLTVDQRTSPEDPDLYFPLAQSPDRDLAVLIRQAAGAGSAVPALRDAVARLDRDVPVYAVEWLGGLVAGQTSTARFTAWLMSLFGGLALLLASLGIYGVIGYSVRQRYREIGIRIALGARHRQIYGLVLRQTLALAAGGVALGLAGSALLTRLLRAQLYGVSPTDPWTLAAVAALVLIMSALAGFVPARGASRVDPLDALRTE